MQMPEKTKIDPKLHRKLLELNNDMESIQKMIAMFQEQCQSRLSRIQIDARATWAAIKEQTGVDLETIVWEPHPTEPLIIPTQVMLSRRMTSKE